MSKNKVERTSLGLRNALFDELDRLKAGETTAQKASATAKLAGQIINSVKIEIDYHRTVEGVLNSKTADAIKSTSVLQLG